ncbi:MAG TPA: malto-oligosyltrehalose synthase [Chryseosolibacter sp.]
MIIPASTYRVQLHKEFNFGHLEEILDYIHDLGITTIYAAPILRATPGSMHGYDTTDPHVINPEIGTLDEFRALIKKVQEKKMSWVQDIVPNHMAFHTDNYRLMDVLERGQHSSYAKYFDILWDHHSEKLKGKVQVPFLGKTLEECIIGKEIKLGLTENGITVDYFQTSYPLSVTAYERIEPSLKPPSYQNDLKSWQQTKRDWLQKLQSDNGLLTKVLQGIDRVNESSERLKEILNNQFYVLCFWKESEMEMGYRRFFTVNELICLRMEDQEVFDEYHTFLYQLYKEGLIQGVRVDHIDGLRDPATYLQRLRTLFGKDCYIIAEKILESKEQIPSSWPLEGTSGYEFLSFASQLMTNRNGAKKLVSFYKDLVPDLPPYKELVRKNKQMILEKYMQGEWDNLVRLFMALNLEGKFTESEVREALAAFMVALPVYRIYPESIPVKDEELKVLKEAFEKAVKVNAGLGNELGYLQSLFTNVESGVDSNNVLVFLQRLMQFTGPLTAKGVEDTTFYVYNALISHDEVGDAPSSLGISISEFHRKMQQRQASTPHSLNATATHDTKRGEDSRLRLNALCDFPDEWIALVKQWMTVNQKFKRRTSKGTLAPTVNDEYYIYQAIFGGFPADFQVTHEFRERVQTYYVKVLREAKVNSDWAAPNEEYEQSCLDFIRQILAPESEFVKALIPFLTEVVKLSNRYSLVQSLIKITSPGIPDTYQGAGLWDLSFVDPDNRRPVDYTLREAYLDEISTKESESNSVLFSYLEDHRLEGVEKLFVTAKALNFRKQNATVFSEGEYLPLQMTGKDMVTVSYARKHKEKWAILVMPLRAKNQSATEDLDSNDEVVLPEGAPSVWKNVFTGEVYNSENRISVGDCCKSFPVALMTNV